MCHILSHLHAQGIRTMATTHYSEIKIYALTTSGIENACCEFDVETLSPTYRLLIGIPGKSNAFAISKKLGLSDTLIDDARTRISSNEQNFEDLLSDLEASRITIEKEQAEINRYKSEIAIKTAELMKKYDVVIWAHHGMFCSGEDFDLTFGLLHTVEKSAEILVKILSMTPNKLQTITPDNFRSLAKDFKVSLPEEFLYEKQ